MTSRPSRAAAPLAISSSGPGCQSRKASRMARRCAGVRWPDFGRRSFIAAMLGNVPNVALQVAVQFPDKLDEGHRPASEQLVLFYKKGRRNVEGSSMTALFRSVLTTSA